MTFDKAAWAINGPQIGAALARRALYATSRQSGIVQKGDLKVKALATPGQGVTIDAGAGVVLNGYQGSSINESYVVSNPDLHTIPAGSMPASNPAAKSYIVAVVLGDSDFSQVGHPWMPSSPPADPNTFVYVRPTLIEVASGATTLNVGYPALVLARIDIPMNTTTVQQSMITDLRKLAAPRQSQQIFLGNPWTNANTDAIPSGSAFADWGTKFHPTVDVPTWAKRAIVVASINGVRLTDSSVNVVGNVRTQLGTVSGPSTGFDIPSSTTGAMRLNLQTAGEYDATTVAGTTVTLKLEGYENTPATPTASQKLTLQGGSQVVYDIRFFEE